MGMVRRIRFMVVLAAILIGAWGCKSDPAQELVGKPFPWFRFAENGSTRFVTLDQLKGAPSLVVFWATWCGPCQEEVGPLRQVLSKYRDRGLKIVGLSIDETSTPVPLMVEKLQIPYPVGTGALPFFDSLKLEYIPLVFLLDHEGVVVESFDAAPAAVLGQAIDKLLAAK